MAILTKTSAGELRHLASSKPKTTMKPPAPPRVPNIQTYWSSPPPEPSRRCVWWQARIRAGWRGNGRVRGLGYYGAAAYFGVYIWEYVEVLLPMLPP